MSSQSVAELDHLHRRRGITRTVAMIVVAWVGLIGGYCVLPWDAKDISSAAVRLALGLVIFVAILGLAGPEDHPIARPRLRAVQALGVVVPLFLVVFAGIYLMTSHVSGGDSASR